LKILDDAIIMLGLKTMLSLSLVSFYSLAAYSISLAYRHVNRQPPSLSTDYPEHKITIPFDHFHNESRYEPHTNETFENSYWLDTSNYVDGGPVFVLAMGEDGVFDLPWLDHGLVHELASAIGGVAVMWGQRYYAGNYFPPGVNASASYATRYNSTNLRFMTTEQALADLAYFAQHVSFPGLKSKKLTAPGTPWFIIGGSYAGVISAFARIQYPDIFWGGLTSSGVTTPIVDFWQAYDVTRRYGPPGCIDVQQKVISIFDTIMLGHNNSAIVQLRTALGADSSSSDVTLAKMLATPMSNFVSSWVPGHIYNFSGPNTYCANLTSQKVLYRAFNNTKMIAAARDIIHNGGWSMKIDVLLHPVLNWFGNAGKVYPSGPNFAAPYDWLSCQENPLIYTSYTPGARGRPEALPVASRLLTIDRELESCRQIYNLGKNWQPDLSYYERFGGFNLSYPRLAISIGQADIWRGATPLAEYISYDQPNPRAKSTGTMSEPQIIIQGGSHEWDLPSVFPNETTSTVPPQVVQEAHQREIAVFKAWLDEWREAHPSSPESAALQVPLVHGEELH